MNEVTKEDREAAWPFRPGPYGPPDKPHWDAGVYDKKPEIQAFAAHRIAAYTAATAAERERCAGVADREYNEMYSISQFHRRRGEKHSHGRTDARARTASIIAAAIRSGQ